MTTVNRALTFGPRFVSSPQEFGLCSIVEQDRFAYCPKILWLLVEQNAPEKFDFVYQSSGLIGKRGEAGMRRRPGSALEVVEHGEGTRRNSDILSTDPFRAFESICFVRLNESISFPRDDWSNNCRANSTLLNCGEVISR